MELAVRLFKNAMANYVGTFVTIITGLLLTPFIIHTLGATGYGIWTLAGSLLAYFALLDFGFANALAKYTAEYIARNDQKTVNRLASTLFIVFAVVGGLALAVAVWLSFNFLHFFTIPVQYHATTRIMLIILGMNFAASLPLSIFNALAVGYQRYDILNTAVCLSLILNAGLTILVLYMGFDLIGLALVTVFTAVLKALLLWYALSHHIASSFELSFALFDWKAVRFLLSYSLLLFIMFACLQVESSAANVIIGRLANMADITTYAIGVKLSGFLKNLILPLSAALFPAFSELSVSSGHDKMARLFVQGMRATLVIAFPAMGILIVLAAPIIGLWVGVEYIGSASVTIVLALQAFLYMQLAAAGTLLLGVGKLRLLAGLHVFTTIFSIMFSWAFVGQWGIIAVAWGSLIPWGVTYCIIIPYACYVSRVAFLRFLKKALLPPLIALLPACLILYGLSMLHYPTNLMWLGFEATIALLVYLLFYLIGFTDRQERAACFVMLTRTLQRSREGKCG